MSKKLSYTCPHCGGHMRYAAKHRDMASDCPHCKRAVVLGSIKADRPPASATPAGRNFLQRYVDKSMLVFLASLLTGLLLIIGIAAWLGNSFGHRDAAATTFEATRPQAESATAAPASRPANPSKWEQAINAVPAGNGNTWNVYPEGVKLDLAMRLEAASLRGNSSQYFLDGLNALFNPLDSTVLDMSLADAARLLESGSAALPKSMRND
jgi:hypothetical protein